MADRLEDHPDCSAWAWRRCAQRFVETLDAAPLDSIAADFHLVAAPPSEKAVTWLLRRGVPSASLLADGDDFGWPIASARIERLGSPRAPRFGFRDDGAPALLILVRDESGNGVDVVAWDPLEDWVAPLLGDVALVGQHELGPSRPDDALTVHDGVLAWLGAGRRGVAVLDQRRGPALLRGAGTLAVTDGDFGIALERRLTVRPKIVVREAA